MHSRVMRPDIAAVVRLAGGVAKVRVLADRGYSRAQVAEALGTGELIRVRNGWVALPDADPALMSAARHGVVLSCVSQARRLGLWVHDQNPGRETLQRLPLRATARRVLDEATPFADAGLETYLRVRLRWLRLPIRFQTWIDGHRVDALVGDRLVLQIDGAHHVGAQRSGDIRHDARLTLMGFHVIRVSYTQMMDEWPLVQDLIMRAVAQGLHKVRRRA